MRFGLSTIPLLLLPYDSLTYLLGANLEATSQTLPATGLFSLVYLVSRRGRWVTSPESRTVLRILLGMTTYLTVVTLVNVVAEQTLTLGADVASRTSAALRQATSLALGLTSFVMFQDALLRIGWRQALRWCLIGSIPGLLLALVQVVRGDIRIQGFSSEPSHFADYIVFILVPTALTYVGLRWSRFVVLAGGLLALGMTFSSTGLLKAVCVIGSYFAWRGKLVRGFFVLGALSALTYGFLSLTPDNYVFAMVAAMEDMVVKGQLGSPSFIDRFGGLAGPISYFGTGCSVLGCGFGGDTVYFDRLFDIDIASVIRDVKGHVVSISSLQGKILLYGGLPGYATYLASWWLAWRSAPPWHASKFMLPAVFLGSLFSLGPFFLPYVWFWLAAGVTAAFEAGPGEWSDQLSSREHQAS